MEFHTNYWWLVKFVFSSLSYVSIALSCNLLMENTNPNVIINEKKLKIITKVQNEKYNFLLWVLSIMKSRSILPLRHQSYIVMICLSPYRDTKFLLSNPRFCFLHNLTLMAMLMKIKLKQKLLKI